MKKQYGLADIVVFFFHLFAFCFFLDGVSLCHPSYPRTSSADQGGHQSPYRAPPASASQVLGLKAWAATIAVIMCLSISLFVL